MGFRIDTDSQNKGFRKSATPADRIRGVPVLFLLGLLLDVEMGLPVLRPDFEAWSGGLGVWGHIKLHIPQMGSRISGT